jgi:uncharacterized membrane protein YkvA (DUF1232 family)
VNTSGHGHLVERDIGRIERRYSRLRRRIETWLEGHTGVDERIREYLLLLPDLFVLLTRLMRDPRVDPALKLQLLAAGVYLVSPIDLIPDFLMPVGLVDDAVAIALVLSSVAKLMGVEGEELLREHWEGTDEVLVQIEGLVRDANRLLDSAVLRRLRSLFGRQRGGR